MSNVIIGRNDTGLVIETIDKIGNSTPLTSILPVIAGGFLPANAGFGDNAPNVVGCTATSVGTKWFIVPNRADIIPDKIVIKGSCSVIVADLTNSHILEYDIHQSGGFVDHIELYPLSAISGLPELIVSVGFEISIVP